ncbi:MAG: Integral rane protein TerC [Gemmatimonadetes bacterium]|nr:Integral rane protein TerC [Gemmatimonadota bacterium]
MHSVWPWALFAAVVLVLLAVDLGVFNRRAHVVTMREAGRWSALMVVLALCFCFGIHRFAGRGPALEFLTGYVIELALSVDNIFVFVLLFTYFKVPPKHQHRVLFWGVLGALIMRGLMIAAGAFLIARFHWVIYVFGAFLVVTGVRMATSDEMQVEPEANPVLKLVRRVLPVSPQYDGQHFFTRMDVAGRLRRAATPLFVVLILVETTDLIFAVDSIPAVFAVTRDPFIVYTSNVFAILGLRSMYFLLAGVVSKFRFLKLGLSAVLVFIGGKMLATFFHYEIPVGISLGVVGALLAASVAASLLIPRKPAVPPAGAATDASPPTGAPDGTAPPADSEAPAGRSPTDA